MEGDDQQDPLVDTARSLLDGHVVLNRDLAVRNHYPAISVLDSLSRLMPAICSPQQIEKAGNVRMLLAAYARAEDLIRIGAYKPGTDAAARQGHRRLARDQRLPATKSNRNSVAG